jgi:hypothetical protein
MRFSKPGEVRSCGGTEMGGGLATLTWWALGIGLVISSEDNSGGHIERPPPSQNKNSHLYLTPRILLRPDHKRDTELALLGVPWGVSRGVPVGVTQNRSRSD